MEGEPWCFPPPEGCRSAPLFPSVTTLTLEGGNAALFPYWSLRLKLVRLSIKRNAGSHWLIRNIEDTSMEAVQKVLFFLH